MRLETLCTIAILGLGTLALPEKAPGQVHTDPRFERAQIAYDEGDYLSALEGFKALLESPLGQEYLERIALITGEYFTTTKVADDARAVRFAPHDSWAAYETGYREERRTHLIDLSEGGQVRTLTIEGTGLIFSPRGDRIAYLGGASDSPVIIRDLRSGRERRLQRDGLRITELAFSDDGKRVYATGTTDGTRSDIYLLSERSDPEPLTDGPGYKFAPRFAKGGRYLIYQSGPHPLPGRGTPTLLAQRGSEGVEEIVVYDLKREREERYEGIAPDLAEDGSTVAYLYRDEDEIPIRALPLRRHAEPMIITRSKAPLSAPTISPDGSRVAYQKKLREDWEIFLADIDGAGEWRVTYDIQHDLYPQFVTPDTLLYVKGEARHRRSYLYAIDEAKEIRLFHNNTLRTIAPEYDWAVSSDGRQILIIAQRDGDTITRDRGLYLIDLTRTITTTELVHRLEENLANERELQARGGAAFAPIAAEVRDAVAEVSKLRLYEYQKALYRFGSKHMTQPGNLEAAEYIYETLRAWGYEPEYQWFEPAPGIRTANVIARLPGTTHPELVYIVGSHFDSVILGPGADDNSSGTAVLLETARVMRERPRAASLLFVFFTAEESGLRGSREFARRALADRIRVVGALNNDMIGYSIDHRLTNTIRYTNPGIRDLQHAAAFLFTRLVTYDARYYQGTDAHSLYDAFGDLIGGLGSYPVLASPHYHEPHAVLAIVDQALVFETAKANIASTMLLASSPSPLSGLEIDDQGHLVIARWNPAPELDIRHYDVAYGPKTDPFQHLIRVTEPEALLEGYESGMVVSVRAVSRAGLVGWDWARTGL